jgi:hypothetical protein
VVARQHHGTHPEKFSATSTWDRPVAGGGTTRCVTTAVSIMFGYRSLQISRAGGSGAWPAVALVGSYELLMALVRAEHGTAVETPPEEAESQAAPAGGPDCTTRSI